MLTLNLRMDHPGRPSDPFAREASLIRQPSAEDLDAAHQLVSSARGARSHLDRGDEAVRGGGEQQGAGEGRGSVGRSMGSLATTTASSGSGQICRYG